MLSLSDRSYIAQEIVGVGHFGKKEKPFKPKLAVRKGNWNEMKA